MRFLRRLWPPSLPRRCFISHSYGDGAELALLKQRLPAHVEPVIFPPIDTSPMHRVSDDLIKAITSCEGLIRLTGPKSLQSFWVSFERDLALRTGMKVYDFNVTTGKFQYDVARPQRPTVYIWSFQREMERQLREITVHLRDKRDFAINDIDEHEHIGVNERYEDRAARLVEEKLSNGGSLILVVNTDRMTAEKLRFHGAMLESIIEKWPGRVLVGVLMSLPSDDSRQGLGKSSEFNPIEADNAMAAALAPYPLFNNLPKSYLGAHFVYWQHVDDLMVRVLYQIYLRANGVGGAFADRKRQ